MNIGNFDKNKGLYFFVKMWICKICILVTFSNEKNWVTIIENFFFYSLSSFNFSLSWQNILELLKNVTKESKISIQILNSTNWRLEWRNGLLHAKMVIKIYINFFQFFLQDLALFECRHGEPCMTANWNFVRFAHS